MFQHNQQMPSWEYPQAPIYTYTENAPPFIPNLQVHPDLINYLPMISAMTANIAGAYAPQSAVRMYCFNSLSANNWMNQSFSAVLKLICDTYVQRVQRAQMQPGDLAGLEQLADEVLCAYGSALAYNNRDVMAVLRPDQQQAVMQNYQLYNAMTGANQQQRSVPGLAQSRGGQFGGNFGGGSAAVPAHPAASQLGGVMQPPAQTVTGNKFLQGNIARPTVVNSTRQSHTVVQPHGNSARQAVITQEAPPPVTQEEVKFTDSIVLGESVMDKNLHNLPYSGYLYPDETPLRDGVQEKLAELIANFEPLTPASVKDYCVSHTTSIHTAMMDILADEIKTLNDTVRIVPNVLCLVVPIIAMTPIKSVFQKFVDIHTFGQLARQVRAIAVNAPDVGKKENRAKQIVWISQFNSTMTSLLNGWLESSFPGLVTIDSFLEDAEALSGYISEQFGSVGLQNFNAFQTRCMRAIHANLAVKEGEENDADACLQMFIRDDSAMVSNITIPCSVFHINLIAEALNYRIPKKYVEVTKTETPYLHQIMELLWANVTFHGTVRNYLLTADGLRFEFQRSGKDNAMYYIREA